MKNYIIVILVVCVICVSCGQDKSQNQTITNQFNPEKYYTTKDSVLLASFEGDIVYVLKDEFNDAVNKHPEFFTAYLENPDNTYAKNPDEQFTSEVGQDMYYLTRCAL